VTDFVAVNGIRRKACSLGIYVASREYSVSQVAGGRRLRNITGVFPICARERPIKPIPVAARSKA
jgi:hypothetical protein